MGKSTNVRYLILSDLHIPDHDKKALALIMKFIADYRPHFIYLLGDVVNFTRISKYTQDPHYHVSLVEEINQAKVFLKELLTVAQKANRKVSITYFSGNHEERLVKYLARNADQIAELNIDGEELISVPHLLELKKLGIDYVPYPDVKVVYNTAFTHGTVIRSKSGYTGQANIDKFGRSGMSGHTHRLSFTSRTQMNDTKWWIETGCLCNTSPTPAYTNYPDWCQGFAIAEYDAETDQLYALQIPIIEHRFNFLGKVYK